MRALLAVVLLVCAFAGYAPAVEAQNGLQVTASFKTISRNDTRYLYYFTDRRINRMMTLQTTAKNVSRSNLPEGTLEWQILVIGLSGDTALYSGTEKFPALKTAMTNEILAGSAQITGWTDGTAQRKDKLEYQVVIKHDGKDTARIASTPNFDKLAAVARRVTPRLPTPAGQ